MAKRKEPAVSEAEFDAEARLQEADDIAHTQAAEGTDFTVVETDIGDFCNAEPVLNTKASQHNHERTHVSPAADRGDAAPVSDEMHIASSEASGSDAPNHGVPAAQDAAPVKDTSSTQDARAASSRDHPPRSAIVKTAAKQTARKRPAARATRPKEMCPGHLGMVCKFSATSPGNPARLPPSRDTCPLCSPAAFKVATSGRRPKIVQILKKLWIARKDLAQEALERIRTWKGDLAAETYVGKMPKSADSKTAKGDWPQLLLRRRLAQHALGKKARRAYYEAVRKDPPSHPTEGVLSPEPVQARLS